MAFEVLLHLVVLRVLGDPWVSMWVDLKVSALDCSGTQVSVVLTLVVRSYMVLGDLEDLLLGDLRVLVVLGVQEVRLEPFEVD